MDIFKETEQQLKELEKEVEEKQKEFWKKFRDLEKKKIEIDEDLLKDFLEEYWLIIPKSESEYEIAVPRWLNFSVGWLDRTTKGYNIFTINKYTQWLGQIPDFLRKELQMPEPNKIKFDGENLIFEEGKEEFVKEKFDKYLVSIGKGSARVKKGTEFDLIASIIDSGTLPFIPKPVDKDDIIPNITNINFDGKYIFQKQAWNDFLKYGAIGIYWMTGAGKDIFSSYALSRIKVKKDNKILPNLYVSPNLTILEQMKKEYFPTYAPELSKELTKGSLILSTYQGYEKLKNIEFGLIVFGECHVLPANTFSRLATLKTKYRIGQSASPYREDGRHNLIFALTGFPIGLNWRDLMKILGKKYHDVNVYIVKDDDNKIKLASNLLNKEKKTIIFVNEIALGKRIADKLGIPFIHGATQNRIEVAKENRIFVASRVMELGVSLKDLQHIIEVDFLFGSKREEIQRTGRLFHSEKGEQHDIIFTKDEFERYGKRLHGLIEKGFRINLKPQITGNFRLIKPEIPNKNKSSTSLSGKGKEILESLFEDGYFVAERNFADVKQELSKRGIPLSAKHVEHINDKLIRMVKDKKLYKVKKGNKNYYVQR